MSDARLKVVVWVALMALLALTVGATFLPLGPWRLAVGLAIAAAKAALIAWVFMELRKGGSALPPLAGLAALFILTVLVGMTWVETASR